MNFLINALANGGRLASDLAAFVVIFGSACSLLAAADLAASYAVNLYVYYASGEHRLRATVARNFSGRADRFTKPRAHAAPGAHARRFPNYAALAGQSPARRRA